MQDKEVDEIIRKLDAIIKLLSIPVISGKSQKDSIITLGQIGLDRNSIAEIVGTDAQQVSVRLSEAKALKKSKSK